MLNLRIYSMIGTLALCLTAPAFAADIDVENLPKDPAGFRSHVEKIVGQADELLQKLKTNPAAERSYQALAQARDFVMREMPKVQNAPDGAKWTADEARTSVEEGLKLLKDQYDKASSSA
jgi:hypothetical protein